jgi:cbb3-type cytochrome oxidase subunit 3
VASPIFAMFSLYQLAVITVLYIYSKEKHGEVANEEFVKEKDGAHLPLIP